VVARDDQDEQAEEDGRQGVEEQSENDRQPVAGFHEAEERHVLAPEQTRQRADAIPIAPRAAKTRIKSPAFRPNRLTGASSTVPTTPDPTKLSRKSVPIVGTTEKYAP
jgi:hypothetical protein